MSFNFIETTGEAEPAESTSTTYNLPEALWVGPVCYEVVEEPRVKQEGDYARVRLDEAVIEVGSPMDAKVQQVHILHEVIHVLLHNAGIAAPDHEERIINALAHGIVDFADDNPEFFQ